MVEKVLMPKLGATMEEGVIDSWLVEVGEEVEEGDPIVEIQTDKITMEIESEADGIILKKLYEQGDTVPVQQVIAFIGEEGEDVDVLTDTIQEDVTAEKAAEEVELGTVAESSVPTAESSDQIRRTPIARRMAEEQNISLHDIPGTGPRGRIQKIDVQNRLKSQPEITPLAKKIAADKELDITTVTGSGAYGKITKADIMQASQLAADRPTAKRTAFKVVRKVIADRISDSFYTAPHVTLFSDIDVTEIVALRKQILPVIEEAEGVRVSYNEIMAKATAFALKTNPSINISLENNEIVNHSEINIGFAVDVKDGLVVPVLRNVDKKSLSIITSEAKKVAKSARDGLLSPDDMQGSTFTISNLGMFAVDGFTPIINQPNAAILGVGRIQEKPVVVDGQVEVRSMMTLSLSFDHRIIDGAPAAQFLTDLKNVLEQPYKLLV